MISTPNYQMNDGAREEEEEVVVVVHGSVARTD